jgi:hypothetical protein
MEELFKGQIPDGELPDIQLYVFPHLREFISVDLREDSPQISLLNTNDLFNEEFFRCVETEFSHAVREQTEFPFDHMINLPLRLEEVIRGVAMTFVLERLEIDPHDEEHLPSVVVFVISGGALALHSGKLIDSLKEFLGGYSSKLALAEWTGVISRLVSEETAALQRVNQQELTDALASDSPDYFTLWENRN